MIFSLLLCISPWKQQHLTIRVNIQVANQPFLLWFEEPSNTLNLLFGQRLFTVESLATRITACSSHFIKKIQRNTVEKQALNNKFYCCCICFCAGLQGCNLNWDLLYCWSLTDLCIAVEGQICFSHKRVSPWSPTYRMTLTFPSFFLSFWGSLKLTRAAVAHSFLARHLSPWHVRS